MNNPSFVNINVPETPTEEMIAFADMANEWAMQRMMQGLVGVSIRMDEQKKINRRIAEKQFLTAAAHAVAGDDGGMKPIRAMSRKEKEIIFVVALVLALIIGGMCGYAAWIAFVGLTYATGPAGLFAMHSRDEASKSHDFDVRDDGLNPSHAICPYCLSDDVELTSSWVEGHRTFNGYHCNHCQSIFTRTVEDA